MRIRTTKQPRGRWVLPIVVLSVVAGTAIPAGASHQKLTPFSFGKMTIAGWRAGEGLPDSSGAANEALLLQKTSPTANAAFAGAIITPGGPAAQLWSLEWEHRADTRCSGTSPRWILGVRGDGEYRLVELPGCAAAAHTPGGVDAFGRPWIRDTYGYPVIQGAIAEEFGGMPDDAFVLNLQIRYDDGPDAPPGPPRVFLDNIKVEALRGEPSQPEVVKVWTYAGDNGGGPNGASRP